MQIAICDDEKEVRDLLAGKVKRLYPQANLCFYADGEELLSAKEQPDILFLDIQMSGMQDAADTGSEAADLTDTSGGCRKGVRASSWRLASMDSGFM